MAGKRYPELEKGKRISHILDDVWDVSRMIVKTGQAKSRSDAIRLIAQGAVSIDSKKISGKLAIVKSGSIIQVGKHGKFVRVINTDIPRKEEEWESYPKLSELQLLLPGWIISESRGILYLFPPLPNIEGLGATLKIDDALIKAEPGELAHLALAGLTRWRWKKSDGARKGT